MEGLSQSGFRRIDGSIVGESGLRSGKWRNAVDLHHLPEGTHSLAPRPGSLVRLAFQKLVGMKGLAPPRLPDSESGPSAIRVKPHAQLEMVLPAGISPATWRFEAARSDSLSYGSMKWGRRGDSHSRGADCPAVYETAAVAAEPRRHEMVGRHGAAPCSAV